MVIIGSSTCGCLSSMITLQTADSFMSRSSLGKCVTAPPPPEPMRSIACAERRAKETHIRWPLSIWRCQTWTAWHSHEKSRPTRKSPEPGSFYSPVSGDFRVGLDFSCECHAVHVWHLQIDNGQ